MEVNVNVEGIATDTLDGTSAIIILATLDRKKFLPIWTNMFSAEAIYRELNSIKTQRPLTHALIKTVIENLHSSVVKVVIDGFDEERQYYHARLHLQAQPGGTEIKVDARPSDAIVLALKASAPIFAESELMNWGNNPHHENKALEDWFEELDPSFLPNDLRKI